MSFWDGRWGPEALLGVFVLLWAGQDSSTHLFDGMSTSNIKARVSAAVGLQGSFLWMLWNWLSEYENRAVVERAWHEWGLDSSFPAIPEMKENCKVFNTDW